MDILMGPFHVVSIERLAGPVVLHWPKETGYISWQEIHYPLNMVLGGTDKGLKCY
jgi:hypothetical protein